MNEQADALALRAACRDAEEAGLALLCDLVVAAKSGRAAIDGMVEAAMKAAGLDVDGFSYDPAKVRLVDEFASATVSAGVEERCAIGRLPGAGGGRDLMLFAHPDPEPFRADPPWSSDPYTPWIEGGRLHGWGVADDLAGIAMLLQSARILKAAGLRLAGDLVLVSAPSKAHRRGIAAALQRGVTADGAVYLHPAESGRGLDEIKGFSPGQLEFSILIGGRAPETSEPAHTAFAHLAVNPFDKAMLVAHALETIDRHRGETVRHPRLEKAVGRSSNLMITACEFGGNGPLSRIPEVCRLAGAVSLIPGEQPARVMKAIEAAVGAAAQTDAFLSEHPPRIAWLAGVSAAETPDEDPLLQLLTATLRKAGASPEINPLHTASDIRNPIVQKGIPTVGFGPLCGGLTMAGKADEWVDIADFHRGIAATVAIAAEWCG